MQVRRPVSSIRRYAPTAGTAAVVVALDQVTKTWALNHLANSRTIHVVWTLQLNLTFNSGVAFGLGKGSTGVIALVGVVALVLLVTLGRSGITNRPQAAAAGLMLGGAVGNMADRLLRDHDGAVVDFIDLQWWPVFNVADAAITCGAILLVASGFRRTDADNHSH